MSELSSAPAPSAGITWADHQGSLMVVEPKSVETGIITTHGVADAVRANVYVLTGGTDSEDYEDSLIFPLVLFQQARRSLGMKIVGRLVQGKGQDGKTPPWLLDAATPEDMAKATAWLQARKPALTGAQPPF